MKLLKTTDTLLLADAIRYTLGEDGKGHGITQARLDQRAAEDENDGLTVNDMFTLLFIAGAKRELRTLEPVSERIKAAAVDYFNGARGTSPYFRDVAFLEAMYEKDLTPSEADQLAYIAGALYVRRSK